MNITYSFVIPVYNEEDSLPELVRRLTEVLDRLDGPAEVLFVDDGSRDRSAAYLAELHQHDSRFVLLRLSRNFGHQIAITAGLDHARGKAAIILDADLQDPPEVALDLAQRWREGYEVVYAVRERRKGESRFKRWSATLFYRLLNRLTPVDIPPDVGDFRLIDRQALEAFRSMRERTRYVRGLFSWVGFRQTGVPYTREGRHAGQTKYPFSRMLRLALDGITSFSDIPLRWALYLGFLVASGSFLAGSTAIVLKLAGVYVVDGWTSLVVALCFLSGVQLMVMGVIGEYLGRVYGEVKCRPLYILRQAPEGKPPA